MTRYLFIALLAVLTLNTGCKLIYKQNVQQGNAHEQEDLDQVVLGMSKKQVAFLLGTPAILDPFHHDRWDYISMLSRRGGEPVRRLVTLTFENDLLIATDGIGDSKGGDIKALEETKSAVADIDDVATARKTELVTDAGVINWTLQLGAFTRMKKRRHSLIKSGPKDTEPTWSNRSCPASVPATRFVPGCLILLMRHRLRCEVWKKT